MKNAKYYINGSRVTINAKDYKKGIAEALGKLVNIVFYKLSYITKSMSENDIRNLFADKGNLIIASENISHNQNAITEKPQAGCKNSDSCGFLYSKKYYC